PRSRERWPNERMSSTPSQRWLRRSSARFFRVMAKPLQNHPRRRRPGCRLKVRSVDRQVGGVDDLFPLRRLGGEEGLEIVRGAGRRYAAEIGELLEHARILERQIDLVVELVDDLL